jgi:hypothetical protein
MLAAPLLRHGYHQALLLGSTMVAIAGVAAAAVCIRFPHHLAPRRPDGLTPAPQEELS